MASTSRRRRRQRTLVAQRRQSQPMDLGAKNWMIRYARDNYWRVAAWIDLEDLLQDGFMCYAKVRAHYPKAKAPAHIMRLFQVTYINYLHTLAKRRSIQTEYAFAMFAPETVFELEQKQTCEFADLFRMMAEAPPLLRRCLEEMMASPKQLRKPYKNSKRHGRETLNERLCRLIGVDPETNDVHTDLVDFLKA